MGIVISFPFAPGREELMEPVTPETVGPGVYFYRCLYNFLNDVKIVNSSSELTSFMDAHRQEVRHFKNEIMALSTLEDMEVSK